VAAKPPLAVGRQDVRATDCLILALYPWRMSDFEEAHDLESLSEEDLRDEIRRIGDLRLEDPHRTDASSRRAVVAYLMRLNEELGRRRGARSGNGNAAVD